MDEQGVSDMPTEAQRRAALAKLGEADQILAQVLDTTVSSWAHGMHDEGPEERPELIAAQGQWEQAHLYLEQAIELARHDAALRLADIDSMKISPQASDRNVDRARGFQLHVREVFWEIRRRPPALDGVVDLPDHASADLAHAGYFQLMLRKNPTHLAISGLLLIVFAYFFLRSTCGS